MPVTLQEMQEAVADYIRSIITTVTTPESVQPGSTGSINPEEEFSFTVIVKNRDIALSDVRHHLTVSPSGRVKLKVPSASLFTTRARNDSSLPPLSEDKLVPEMVLFPLDNTIAAGEDSVLVLRGKTEEDSEGDATLKYHLHADVNTKSIFALGKTTEEDEVPFEVV